jgi:hypothetical protein
MEYGDDDVRVLTEIDKVEAPRRIRRVPELNLAILIDENGHRERWDFTIENPMYGKLVCTYYPGEALPQLVDYFVDVFAEYKHKSGDRSINPVLPPLRCASAGGRYLRKQIQQGVHDALCGLLMEAGVYGLRERNGHEFIIPKLAQKRRVKRIRDHYTSCMNKRLGTRQGQRKDTVDFLFRAYQAYRDAADELKISVTDGVTRKKTMKVTQEKLVKHMKSKRRHDGEEAMSIRGFTKQLKEHGLTYSELVDRCEYIRRDTS